MSEGTVIADGYVKPIMQRYIEEAFAAFAEFGVHVPWSLMKSNGGKTPPTPPRPNR